MKKVEKRRPTRQLFLKKVAISIAKLKNWRVVYTAKRLLYVYDWAAGLSASVGLRYSLFVSNLIEY